jgi:hypothetical protein
MVANLNTAVNYHRFLTLENVGTAINCYGIFITLAPDCPHLTLATLGVNPIKLFTDVIYELYPSEASTISKLLALPANIRLGCKGLLITKICKLRP